MRRTISLGTILHRFRGVPHDLTHQAIMHFDGLIHHRGRKGRQKRDENGIAARDLGVAQAVRTVAAPFTRQLRDPGRQVVVKLQRRKIEGG